MVARLSSVLVTLLLVLVVTESVEGVGRMRTSHRKVAAAVAPMGLSEGDYHPSANIMEGHGLPANRPKRKRHDGSSHRPTEPTLKRRMHHLSKSHHYHLEADEGGILDWRGGVNTLPPRDSCKDVEDKAAPAGGPHSGACSVGSIVQVQKNLDDATEVSNQTAEIKEVRSIPLPEAGSTGVASEDKKAATGDMKREQAATTYVVRILPMDTEPVPPEHAPYAEGVDETLTGDKLFPVSHPKPPAPLTATDKAISAGIIGSMFILFIFFLVGMYLTVSNAFQPPPPCHADGDSTLPGTYVVDEHFWTWNTKCAVHAVHDPSNATSKVDDATLGEFNSRLFDSTHNTIIYTDRNGNTAGYMRKDVTFFQWGSQFDIHICGNGSGTGTTYSFDSGDHMYDNIFNPVGRVYTINRDGVKIGESVKTSLFSTNVEIKTTNGTIVGKIERDMFNWGTDHWAAETPHPETLHPIVMGFIATSISKAQNDRNRRSATTTGSIVASSCFPKGTLVTMADRTAVAIDALRVGDGTLGGAVKAVMRFGGNSPMVVINGVTVTEEHPVRCPGDLVFRHARDCPESVAIPDKFDAVYDVVTESNRLYIGGMEWADYDEVDESHLFSVHLQSLNLAHGFKPPAATETGARPQHGLVGSTQVRMADGATKRLDSIRVGDDTSGGLVLSVIELPPAVLADLWGVALAADHVTLCPGEDQYRRAADCTGAKSTSIVASTVYSLLTDAERLDVASAEGDIEVVHYWWEESQSPADNLAQLNKEHPYVSDDVCTGSTIMCSVPAYPGPEPF